MIHEARATPVVYKGRSRPHQTTTWWCTNCYEGILEPAMLAERERVFIELRAEIDEILLPERVASIRKKLGISQREASKVLGGGANAFQRYESGEVPVSDAMKNLLILLDNDPNRLLELARKTGERLASSLLASRVAAHSSVTRKAVVRKTSIGREPKAVGERRTSKGKAHGPRPTTARAAARAHST
jgi:HTH-type transcriptional regulator/antitoxin MqsA